MGLRVAIVSRDPDVRMAAARAFGAAPAEWSVVLCEHDPGDAQVIVHGCDLATEDGIVFDPASPDEALRAVGAALARPELRRPVVVAGAVGGAGATSLALHLAAEWGPGTCYAEAGGTGAATRLGLPEDARAWQPGDDAPAALPVSGGFRVFLSPRPSPGPAEFPLRAARDACPRLVLDAGTRRDLGPLLEGAGAAVLVTTPTRPSALAARALLELHPETRWVVVVNRVGPGGQIMRSGLEALIGRPVAVELPCCPGLRDAEDEARLLAGGWHRWRRGVARLARALETC